MYNHYRKKILKMFIILELQCPNIFKGGLRQCPHPRSPKRLLFSIYDRDVVPISSQLYSCLHKTKQVSVAMSTCMGEGSEVSMPSNRQSAAGESLFPPDEFQPPQVMETQGVGPKATHTCYLRKGCGIGVREESQRQKMRGGMT